ncbi:MAG TPA: hypothetical protein VJT76_00430, partial [Gaiella sp.]|nr:hypothetical protein [Gaiella sp.]
PGRDAAATGRLRVDVEPLDAYLPLVAELDYRDPIDLADDVELLVAGDGQALCVGFRVGEAMRAVARVAAGRPPGSR